MEDQNEESKYFHAENIGKNLITTIIGSVLMSASGGAYVASWFVDLPKLPSFTILGIVFGVGFALLFMRDKISTYIDIFTRKKIDSTK